MRKPPVRGTHQKDKPNGKQQGKRGRKRKKSFGGNGRNVSSTSNERNRMPCKSCGGSKPSLQAEREREAKAIERRKQTEQAKAQFMTRRADLVAQVKAQREAARRG